MPDLGSLVLAKYEYSNRVGWKVGPGLITSEYQEDYILIISKIYLKNPMIFCHFEVKIQLFTVKMFLPSWRSSTGKPK